MKTHLDDGSTRQVRTARSLAAPVFTRLIVDTRGSVAIQFALLALVILALAGGAIDYANVATIRSTLQEAADSAATASVSKTSAGATAAQLMTGNGVVTAGQTDAMNIFNANISKIKSNYTVTASAAVSKSGLTITSVITYSINVPTSFLGLLNIPTWQVAGTATATSNLSPYIDFYLLLDNTPSMGIGATQADITTMVNNTPDQCAFACHEMDTSPNDYYNRAKYQLGVQMRIDVVRQAAQNLTTTAQNAETIANQFRMAVYTFGASAATIGFTPVAPLSSNLSLVNTQASAVDVMSVPYQGYNNDQDTDFDTVLSNVNQQIPNAGDGSSSLTPQKVLFFVSDGLADANYPNAGSGPNQPLFSCSQANLGGGRCQEPINTTSCTAIKAKGIKIAVLYTTYYPLTTNSWYNNTVAPWASQISQNMQACASPGLYFEVSPTQGISAAMTALFNLALRQVRITN